MTSVMQQCFPKTWPAAGLPLAQDNPQLDASTHMHHTLMLPGRNCRLKHGCLQACFITGLSSKAAAAGIEGIAQQTSTTKQAERMLYLTSSTDPLVGAAAARIVQLLPCCFLTNQLRLAHCSKEVSLQAAAIFAALTRNRQYSC